MATATSGLTKEEIVQRGKEIYESDIRPVVKASHVGLTALWQPLAHRFSKHSA